MRLVLRFYVERVFGNYPSSQPEDRRRCSALANSFITIRRNIHKCVSASWRPAARLGCDCRWLSRSITTLRLRPVQNCSCAEETQRIVDTLHAEYNKVGAAPQGETPCGDRRSSSQLLSLQTAEGAFERHVSRHPYHCFE